MGLFFRTPYLFYVFLIFQFFLNSFSRNHSHSPKNTFPNNITAIILIVNFFSLFYDIIFSGSVRVMLHIFSPFKPPFEILHFSLASHSIVTSLLFTILYGVLFCYVLQHHKFNSALATRLLFYLRVINFNVCFFRSENVKYSKDSTWRYFMFITMECVDGGKQEG